MLRHCLHASIRRLAGLDMIDLQGPWRIVVPTAAGFVGVLFVLVIVGTVYVLVSG